MEETKNCGTCRWHDEFFGVCYSAKSDRCADTTEPEDSCDKWETDNSVSCRDCCEYDHVKGKKTGYCCRGKKGGRVVNGDDRHHCQYFIKGEFKDRLKLRKEKTDE